MKHSLARLASLSVLRVGLLACVVSAAGCADNPASPTMGTISAAGLAGTWQLEVLQPTGQGAVLKPAGRAYTVTLANGTVSARADCNTCAGIFTLVGDQLTISSTLACTRAACAAADGFDALYTRLLTGESTVEVVGNTIILSSNRGFMRFTR